MRLPSILGYLRRNVIRGSRNAADFPEPVGARPIMSRIAMPIGIACIWIGRGSLNPLSAMFSLTALDKPFTSSQFRIGSGHLPPLIRISLSSLKIRQSLSLISSFALVR